MHRGYPKARLEEATIAFTKTHDLERLLDLVLIIEPEWASLRPALAAMTDYAVEARYPGRTTTPMEASALSHSTAHVRRLIRQSLGLRN
jgi:hypothetical protein